jgi:ATP-binding cassette subfamily B protein/subfamily B ATP-binding cassette protein MsbA
MFVGALRVHDGVLSIGSLLVFFTYGRMVQRQVADLIVSYGRFKEAVASADRVLEVLEEEPDVRDAPHAQAPVGRAAGEVRLEGVTFGYEPGRPVLEGVSVGADPGEAVALVGHTGAGKSTLVSLIPRFFDPWSGRVTVDRHDVRDLTLASVRAQISVVLQEPFLLPLSVAENIAYGRPGASPREVVAAAVAAQADEFIRALPDGYETVIDERGASLSGGERQRLAIARALLKDAPILILDEPTSALDSETEASLLQALERLIEGRTTFVIAHRLSTVRRCNRIVVLDHGRIAEIGSHNELANAGGIYQRVHLLQMGFDTNHPLDDTNHPPAERKQSPATFPRQRASGWRMRWIWRRVGRERRPTT